MEDWDWIDDLAVLMLVDDDLFGEKKNEKGGCGCLGCLLPFIVTTSVLILALIIFF